MIDRLIVKILTQLDLMIALERDFLALMLTITVAKHLDLNQIENYIHTTIHYVEHTFEKMRRRWQICNCIIGRMTRTHQSIFRC